VHLLYLPASLPFSPQFIRLLPPPKIDVSQVLCIPLSSPSFFHSSSFQVRGRFPDLFSPCTFLASPLRPPSSCVMNGFMLFLPFVPASIPTPPIFEWQPVVFCASPITSSPHSQLAYTFCLTLLSPPLLPPLSLFISFAPSARWVKCSSAFLLHTRFVLGGPKRFSASASLFAPFRYLRQSFVTIS